MKKKTTLLLIFITFGALLYGQEQSTSTYDNRYAIALNGSTLGGGLEVARNISPKLNLRLRANTLSIENYVQDIDVDDATLNVTADTRFLEFDLSLEYLPFTKSSFKLVGGASYFTDGKTTALGTYDGEITYGEIVLGPEDIGDLEVTLDYNGFAPYVGLGFGRAVPKKTIGVAFEAGTFYLPKPEVGIVATGMLEPTSEQASSLEEDIKDYRWFPYLNLRISVKI